jgi:hypothetical protein
MAASDRPSNSDRPCAGTAAYLVTEGVMQVRLGRMCPLFQVFDMQRSLAFYRAELDFQVVQYAPPGGRTATGACFGATAWN